MLEPSLLAGRRAAPAREPEGYAHADPCTSQCVFRAAEWLCASAGPRSAASAVSTQMALGF